MGVSYNNSKIIPAPFIQYSKQYNVSADGTQIGSTYQIKLDGQFIPDKGSPNSSGIFWTGSGSPADESFSTDLFLSSIIKKQEGIRTLFAQDGRQLRVDGLEGISYLTSNPRVKSIQFPEGNQTSWANRAQYSVELEADVIYKYDPSGFLISENNGIPSGFKLESAEESWNIESQNEDLLIFRLSHQVQAKGKKFYSSSGTLDKQAWENAQDYVLTQLGLDYDRLYAANVLNLTGYSGYNYVRSQQVNELGGTFGVNETWLVYQPGLSGYHASEEFEVNLRISDANLASVTLQGKVQGFKVSDNQTYSGVLYTKYDNALAKYNATNSIFFTRAQAYSGLTLNPTPIQQTLGMNPVTGTINYNVEYDNRPTATISGARSESISVNYDYQTDIFAALQPLGRAAGPILQSLSTLGPHQITVNIEAIFPVKSQVFTPTKPDTNVLASGFVPTATWVFKNIDRENWDAYHGRYSRTIGWTYNS